LILVVACTKASTQSEPNVQPGAVSNQAPKPDMAKADKGAQTFDERLRLKPDEGTLAITPPADTAAGTEAVAKIVVTPKTGYHVNTEYPIKLTLDPPANVKLDKQELTAGGHDKAKGDAEALDETQLVLAIKMTPAQSGSYTINGTFKFAVCDKDQCLAKKEPIAIQIAAK
jgi:hypothetical protein